MSLAGGCAAGIFGFTGMTYSADLIPISLSYSLTAGLYGFLFYFIVSSLVGVFIMIQTGFQHATFFRTTSALFLEGLSTGLGVSLLTTT